MLTERNTAYTRIKVKSVAGLLLLCIPALAIGWWIHSFNAVDHHEGRVALFNSYLPELLRGRHSITLLNLFLTGVAIALNVGHWSKRSVAWKIIAILVIGAAGLLFCLNLFSLL